MPRNDLIQLRRATATQWATANPVLAAGEPGFDTTNLVLKVGDGTKTWAALPAYAGSGTTSTASYLRGVNSQGGAGSIDDGTRVPGTLGTDYFYPTQSYFNWLAARGHTIVRLDFLWERVISSLNGPIRTVGMNELKATVQRASNAGLSVLLDMKNYGRFWNNSTTRVKFGEGIDVAWFADAWSKIATEFKDQPAIVGWGLMNEPWGLINSPSGSGSGPPLADSTWKVFSRAATAAIRATGDTRDVYVAGDQFGGAWGWTNINGAPWIADDHVVYEPHIYLDNDRSGQYTGTYAQEQAKDVANGWLSLPARVTADVQNFLTWAKTNKVRAFVGEIGWPSRGTGDDALWNAVGETVYTMLDAAGVGATYWSAGEFSSGSAPGGRYELDLYDRANLVPQPQTTVVEQARHLSRPGTLVGTAEAIETVPKLRPKGAWDFLVAPTVAGSPIGGSSAYSIGPGGWWTPGVGVTGTASLGATLGRGVFFPIVLPSAMTLESLSVEVTTAAAAGGVLRAAVYGVNATTGLPDFSALKVSTAPVASTATGMVTFSGLSAVLPAGVVWVALVAQVATCTVRTVTGGYTAMALTATPGPGTNLQVLNSDGITGAFPTSGGVYGGGTLIAPPKVYLRAAP